jgi:flagellar motor switch protein FliN
MSEPQSNEPVSMVEDGASAAAATARADDPIQRLPSHTRGVLKVTVPIRVTLASQRKSVQEIIELGPGSILSFDKSCEEPMDLMVGNRTLAQGEVVKVGDKFGLRIRNIVGK